MANAPHAAPAEPVALRQATLFVARRTATNSLTACLARLQRVPLIPAHAGIQGNERRSLRPWVPAFAATSGD